MEQIEFRRADAADLPGMMRVIEDGKAFLKSQGVDQWQKGDPSAKALEKDIENGDTFVLCQNNIVVGTLALLLRSEANYNNLREGTWGTSEPYAVIHRLALAAAARGTHLGQRLMQEIKVFCLAAGFRAIRIDTHRQNVPMQRYLAKNGFVQRGAILLASGAEKGNERIVLDCRLDDDIRGL